MCNILLARAISSPLALLLRSLPSSHHYPTKTFAIICKLNLNFHFQSIFLLLPEQEILEREELQRVRRERERSIHPVSENRGADLRSEHKNPSGVKKNHVEKTIYAAPNPSHRNPIFHPQSIRASPRRRRLLPPLRFWFRSSLISILWRSNFGVLRWFESVLLFCVAENVVSKKRVEDVMPIATGHEREELEAELKVSFILCVLCDWL